MSGKMKNKKKPQEPEHRSADLVQACRALYSAIDLLDQTAAERVKISRNDLRALNALEHGPKKIGVLSRELSLTSGSMTALVDRLEKRGLVRRAPDPKDRRSILIEPTPRMYEQLAPLYKSVAEALSLTERRYDPEERSAAIRHLDDARLAMELALKSHS